MSFSLSIFWLIWGQSGSQPPDAWSDDIRKIKEVLVLEGIFSKPIYVCVLTYQSWSF